MKFNYIHFRIFLHLLVAAVFLVDLFKPTLPEKIYNFLETNRDIIFGCYYLYLAYEIYNSIEIETPILMSPRRPINIGE